MRNYYFVAASLPPLEIGKTPGLTFEELQFRLQQNLSKADLEKVALVKRYVDLSNIRALLLEEPIDPHGNYDEKDLDQALFLQEGLPEYVFDFLSQYETNADKLKHFSGLISRYFSEEIPRRKGFLKQYLTFERECRLVLTALRAKRIGRDIVHELQFEDFTDYLVAQILSQKDAPDYEPPAEYAALKEMVVAAGADPLELHRRFAAYRFHKVEEMADGEDFSINRILAYVVQLMIVEYYNELDEKKGHRVLDTLKTS